MDRIELAEQRYRDIVTDELAGMAPEARYRRMPVRKILAWIDNYVLPAIEEVYHRPLFRDHATWPQRVLAPGADTPERAAIERVDQGLVVDAQALHRLTRNRLVTRILDERALPQQGQTTAERVTDQEGLEWVRGMPERQQMIPYYVAQTASMSRRAWRDLVCVEDYLFPMGGMMQKAPLPKGATEGALVVSLTPHLFQVGDLVTRSMMQRIRSWLSLLAEARSVIYDAVRATGRPYARQVEIERDARRELDESHKALRRLCLIGPDARAREACITLVQVYAEFHPDPELDWLGISGEALSPFKGLLRHNLESIRDLETVDRIAAALGDLKHMYRDLAPEQPAVEAAIATGGLVLIEPEGVAYWEGTKIECDWSCHRKAWEMLWKLAANARLASPVNDVDLYGYPVSPSTMYNRWSRLRSILPPSLRGHVTPGVERATYRLTIRINEIHLFDPRRAGG